MAVGKEQARLTDFRKIQTTPTLPGFKTTENIQVQFYPYTSLKNTIRQREGMILIRLSDMLEDSPSEVQSAICSILFHKLKNKPVPKDHKDLYNNHIYSKKFADKVSSIRRARGKKVLIKPQGAFFDLEKMFESINSKYFDKAIKKPIIGWSPKRTASRFGHYDPDIFSISISRILDSKDTPAYVVEYVLFHEMLHIKFATKYRKGRRSHHHRQFKQAETLFPKYEQANKWLRSCATKTRRKTRYRGVWGNRRKI